MWITKFQTENALTFMPRPRQVGYEEQTSDYRARTDDARRHDYSCFQCTVEGEGCVNYKQQLFRLPPGTGFLMNTKLPGFEYFYPANGRKPWKFWFIEFTGGNSLDMVKNIIELHGPIHTIDMNSDVWSKIMRFKRYSWTTLPISASNGASLIFDLITDIIQSHDDKSSMEKYHGMLIENVCNHIRTHIDENLNVTRLASTMKVSREHLTRVFKSRLNISPFQYLLYEKMNFACSLLNNTTLTNKEIASQIGDDSPAHFARIFKQTAGVTPKQFRLQKNRSNYLRNMVFDK